MTRSARLKERILKVAGEHFLTQGFHKVSIDSLVAELRTSKSSIYKHFPSKEAIVATLVDQINAAINRQLQELVDSTDLEFEEKLVQVMRFTGRISRLVSKAFLDDLRIHTPELWDAFQQQKSDRVRKGYLRLFQQGAREGLIRADVDLHLATLAYLQLSELAADPERSGYPQGNGEDIHEQLAGLFMEGILNA